MRARMIDRWVGRAMVFAALGVGFFALAGLANAGGVAGSAAPAHTAVDNGSGFSARDTAVSTMDFDWN
ncbi:hypothetical protein SAMN05444365_103461 [Micromonospora pattaloongensis]|uniref:Uncharacterized protein n=1 Tax=Micromonospora pattaloongensis TaxID=405436 RepID=A0A1H3MNI5_9ACTN|nr:hypothetical protein [Micromonospora pattaloongensis]SDY78292.1 hypothetical protein SAMN05444365_103461 [Micromonospora pattaloongensis]